jgi:type IV pilus assembly protein PilA
MAEKQEGFSVIEILIIVAIILIIAAIAIPNLLRSKMASNEASAVDSLRMLNSTSTDYFKEYGGYPVSISVLGPVAIGATASSGLADMIDEVLATGLKSGYSFTWSAGTSDANGNVLDYSITARPSTPGISGQRYFYTDQSGVIRSEQGAPATAVSTPLS